MSAAVDTTACTMPVSIILEITRPILAMVMAPERVRTTLQSGSFTMASVTSKASPRLRPLKAVRPMARRSSANEVTLSRSRLSRGTSPSSRPSWNARSAMIRNTTARVVSNGARTIGIVKRDDLRRRLDALYAHYDHRFVDPDPLQWVRQQEGREDREVVGLVASGLAFGNVRQIKSS